MAKSTVRANRKSPVTIRFPAGSSVPMFPRRPFKKNGEGGEVVVVWESEKRHRLWEPPRMKREWFITDESTEMSIKRNRRNSVKRGRNATKKREREKKRVLTMGQDPSVEKKQNNKNILSALGGGGN